MKSAESARVLVVFILDIGGSGVVAGKRVVAGKAEVALGVTVVFEAELSQGRGIGWQFDDWNVVVRQSGDCLARRRCGGWPWVSECWTRSAKSVVR